MKKQLFFVIALIAIFFQDCKKDATIQQAASLSSHKLSSSVTGIVIQAEIKRLDKLSDGKYNYTISLYAADVASPNVPLALPGPLTVHGTLTDGAVHNDFTVTLKAGTLITSGAYTLFSPVIITGGSVSPGSYQNIPINFTGTFTETPCTQNTPTIVFNDAIVYNGAASRVAFDTAGNSYVIGAYYGSADINPGTGILTIGGSGIFIEKLTPAGALEWGKPLTTDQPDNCTINMDAAQNIYGTSYRLAPDSNFMLNLTKLDVAGNIAWAKPVMEVGTTAKPIVNADNAGNIYVAVNDPAMGNILQKVNSGGTVVWTDHPAGRSVTYSVSSGGTVNIRGSITGVTDIDPGANVHNVGAADVAHGYSVTLNDAGNYVSGSIFQPTSGATLLANLTIESSNTIIKYDDKNKVVWKFKLGKNTPTYVVTDADGNFYLSGEFRGSVNFNPSGTPFILKVKGSASDTYIEKIDASGNFVWATQPNTLPANVGYSGPESLAVDQIGNIYTTGYYADQNFSAYNIFIGKLSQCR